MSDLSAEFKSFSATPLQKKIFLSESDLFDLLRKFHPMRYFELAEKLSAVFLEKIGQIKDQFDSLRFVYFIDKLYDYKVQIFASATVDIDGLFPEDFYKSAYAKKYWRCISRLKEICR
jgi:cell division protein ZapE